MVARRSIRKRYGRRRRTTTLSKMARGKATPIVRLARQVRVLQRYVKRDQQYLNYAHTFAATNISSTYTVFTLNDFSAWSRIFGTTSNDDTQNGCIWKSSGIDMKFDIGSEPANVNFTVMLLQLRDEGANLLSSGGVLTLTSGDTHYTQSGLTMVNKKYFKILATRRFSLGNNGQPASTSTAQTQFGIDRRYYMKIRPNKMITNPSGDWKNLQRCLDPSGNYFIVAFNDNSALDLEYPQCTMNCVHTIQTL